MILILAISIILLEAVTEGFIKRYYPKISEFIFEGWVQWIIAIILFGIWFWIAISVNEYIPIAKLIIGFVFVRFLVFDVVWNLVRGVRWNYYGTTKLYDRIMTELADWGWFMKFVLGVVGICFLLGIK